MVKKCDSYLKSFAFTLQKTARINELLGRIFYKDNIIGKKSILELDEFIILSFIKNNPKITQSEISKNVFKGKAHIGKILSEMEQKGYIKRKVDLENNIMVKHAEITRYGEALYKTSNKYLSDLEHETVKIFSDAELETLFILLEKYSNNILSNYKINF